MCACSKGRTARRLQPREPRGPRPRAICGFLRGAPGFQEDSARGEIEFAHVAAESCGVGSAGGANASIALEHFFAEIGRIGAQAPFVHAGSGAEGAAAFGGVAGTPAAFAIGPFGPATGFGARGEHGKSVPAASETV